MKDINIKQTERTPLVSFKHKAGEIIIKGRSIPDDCYRFYKPLMEAMDRYIEHPQAYTKIIIELDYFNTGTSKMFYDFFSKIGKIESHISIEWRYDKDDDDILESGEDFEELTDIKFKFIEIT